MGASYITTDLEFRTRFVPSELNEELRKAGLHGGISEHDGYWRGGYSCGECVYHPTSALDHLLTIIETLSTEGRDQWNRSFSRRFDMGFESFDERFSSRWQVNAGLMRRLADVDGDLVVTIYRGDGFSPSPEIT